MLGNRGPWLGQVQLVRHPWLGQPIDTSQPSPPSQASITCKRGISCPTAFCLTIGPVSAPDLDKVRAQLQAKPSGAFYIYPRTVMGPGDQDYVVWCNAYSTPVAGAVVWVPPAGLVSAPSGSTAPAPVDSGQAVAAPPGATPASAVPSPTASLLAFLAFR
jgi:hypothetical protein